MRKESRDWVGKFITAEQLAKVDPRLREMAEGLYVSPSLSDTDPLEFRKMTREYMARATPLPVEGLAKVWDDVVPGPVGPMPIRIYTPEGSGPFPVVMYFHGGGWVAGDLDTEDNICRMVCGASRCVVVSVEYRLGPEHKFPAAPEDCYAATRWVAANAERFGGDGQRLAVMGQSAGGGLAAAVCLMAKDRGGPRIRHQVLVYAGLEQMEGSVPGYIDDLEDRLNPYASPVLAKNFEGLPPTTILTAECDTCIFGCVDYAQRLIEAGVETHYRRYPGMLHGFLGDENLEACHQAIRDVATTIRKAMG